MMIAIVMLHLSFISQSVYVCLREYKLRKEEKKRERKGVECAMRSHFPPFKTRQLLLLLQQRRRQWQSWANRQTLFDCYFSSS
jgi:hypothetical protein